MTDSVQANLTPEELVHEVLLIFISRDEMRRQAADSCVYALRKHGHVARVSGVAEAVSLIREARHRADKGSYNDRPLDALESIGASLDEALRLLVGEKDDPADKVDFSAYQPGRY